MRELTEEEQFVIDHLKKQIACALASEKKMTADEKRTFLLASIADFKKEVLTHQGFQFFSDVKVEIDPDDPSKVNFSATVIPPDDAIVLLDDDGNLFVTWESEEFDSGG